MKSKKWAKGITDIRLVTDLGKTPASVNRRTGVVYINDRIRKTIPKEEWNFILLHEMGHLAMQTSNEEEADTWAFAQYANAGGKLSKAVKAMTEVLNMKKPAHLIRANLMLKRAQAYDKNFNHIDHEKKKNHKKKINRRDQQNYREIEERVQVRQEWPSGKSQKLNRAMGPLSQYTVSEAGDLSFDGYEDFLGGLFKKNGEDGEGGSFGEKFKNTVEDLGAIGQTIGNTVGSFRYQRSTGAGGNETPHPLGDPMSAYPTGTNVNRVQPKSEKKDKTVLYFGMAAGLLIVIFLGITFMKK